MKPKHSVEFENFFNYMADGNECNLKGTHYRLGVTGNIQSTKVIHGKKHFMDDGSITYHGLMYSQIKHLFEMGAIIDLSHTNANLVDDFLNSEDDGNT